MMETYGNQHIQEIPLSSPFFHGKVERFLRANGLRMEALDSYYTLENADGDILAGAGLRKDVIQCVAVAPEARSEGLTAPLISHIIAAAAGRGVTCLKVFTKVENTGIFESLGFHVLAQAPQAVLMENGRGLEQYCAYLKSVRRSGKSGVVVMNANPFTLGHRYLLDRALEQVDTLYIIPVKEDVSRFPYADRKAMIEAGAPEGVLVVEGSDYQISHATFPTYFLKDLSDAAPNQMRLDLDMFARHIAPALGVSVRFVGSEPTDALTARYNELMKEVLPIDVVEIPRLCCTERSVESISASAVRAYLDAGDYVSASALVPESSWPYLKADLANRALLKELDTPGKPGLVGPDSNGAHSDMDYALMRKAISALYPFWAPMADAGSVAELRELGLKAEKAMLSATGGVNTHKGAIYALGLALYDTDHIAETAKAMPREGVKERPGIKGARDVAEEGYQALFQDWLPYYRSTRDCRKTLLLIMSALDDTCVIRRVGYDRARQVKEEAKAALEDLGQLPSLCEKYAAEGISPGGSADMLALTIFIDSIKD